MALLQNPPLPVDAVLPELLEALDSHNLALLQAPTGSGKTTRVPLALLAAPWRGSRRILMLEPRRLAARAAARYMARQLGQSAGEQVGYRTRLDSRVSEHSRIEVVTEGIFIRLIQEDPELSRYAAVIFDEFHERSLQADLALALVRDSQQALRPDLRVLLMSATLDHERLRHALGNCPFVQAEGRSFPVGVHYRPRQRHHRHLEAQMSAVLGEVLEKESGSILVFLPGMAEIRKLAAHLNERLPDHVQLHLLHGQLDPSAQDAAIAPPEKGVRKLVLASAIAESSLTLEGIRVVVDACLRRSARFDPNSGMTRLITTQTSQAAAEQRRGRAGRLEPGQCYRLLSEAEFRRLPAQEAPEILSADLAPAVLELACWGVNDPAAMFWLDPPPDAAWQQAVDLLIRLEALDDRAQASAHGHALRQTGLHPRLAHMVVRGRELGLARTAAELAGLLQERDLPGYAGIDMELRLARLRSERPRQGPLARAQQLARRLAGREQDSTDPPHAVGRLLALAWPDRIGQARGQRGRFLLANGRGAMIETSDALAGTPWLVACNLDGQAQEARIWLGAALSRQDIEEDHAENMEWHQSSDWDEQRGTLLVRRQRRLGALVLEEELRPASDAASLTAGLLAAVRRKGLEALPWTEGSRQLQARMRLLHRLWPEEWPVMEDQSLIATLEDWLAPWLTSARRWADVQKLDLHAVLSSQLDFEHKKRLEQLAPSHWQLPNGRRRRLDYCNETPPVLAVRLQDLLGCRETPRIAGGRVAITLHLLSPANRPLAITADLASFWQHAYPEVRKAMRGRYPKHDWPEDP